MKKTVKFLSMMVVLTGLFCHNAFAAAQGTGVDVGDVAPDFTLKEFTTGKDISLSDYKGKKIVLIQFWATWCAICRREIPLLVNHYNDNKDKGDFEILAVLLPSGENDKRKVTELIKKFKIPYPIVVDADNKVATEKYELSGLIPVIVIIDKEGIMQFEHVGELDPTVDPIDFVLDELRGVEE